MVSKILERLTAPVRGLHQAAYLLAGLTLASQVLALARDRIFAHSFGPSETLDLYYAAFKVPDLVFALIASLVSAYVLIPRIAQIDTKEARRLISQTTSFLLIAGGLVSIVLAVLAPSFIFILFPAFKDSAHAGEFVMLARLLLVQPILLGLSGILTSVTQINRRFFLFAMSPVLYNLGIILGAVYLYPYFGLAGIGFGVIGGAILHLAIHVPVVMRAGLFPTFIIPSPKVIWSVMKDSVPRSLALAFGSITTLVLTSLASHTGTGGISIFTLAGNLEAVPLSLIGASYATAAFPVLAEHMGAKRIDEFKATLTAAARHLIFWSTVVSVLVIVLRAHLVRILLGSGAFDWNDTRLTAAVLAILVVALTAQSFILLASRAFYAAQRSWNPLFIQLGGVLVSGALAYGMLLLADAYPVLRFFVQTLFRVDDVPGSAILFIALGATIGQLVMGAVAACTLGVVAPKVVSALVKPLFDALAAAIIGGSSAYGALFLMGNIAPLTSLLAVFTQAAVAGMVGLAVSASILILLENQEFRDLYESLRKMTSFKALKPHDAVLGEPTQ